MLYIPAKENRFRGNKTWLNTRSRPALLATTASLINLCAPHATTLPKIAISVELSLAQHRASLSDLALTDETGKRLRFARFSCFYASTLTLHRRGVAWAVRSAGATIYATYGDSND